MRKGLSAISFRHANSIQSDRQDCEVQSQGKSGKRKSKRQKEVKIIDYYIQLQHVALQNTGETMTSNGALRIIKLVHTIVWAFFAGCIIAIPIMSLRRRCDLAMVFIGIVLIEVLILVVNRWRCPLTGVAARYTNERKDNFDIYLPLWIARNNKLIFGLLFLGGSLFTLVRCAGWFE